MVYVDKSLRKQLQNRRNRQAIYNAVFLLENATVKEIWGFLEGSTKSMNRKMSEQADIIFSSDIEKRKYLNSKLVQTIHPRTIQRYLKRDKRIRKSRTRYYIDQKARFEYRNLDPEGFGNDISREILRFVVEDNSINALRLNLRQLITRFGALIVFIFIETLRPFKDPSMSIPERHDLTKYWVTHGIPLSKMFEIFKTVLRGQSDLNMPPNEFSDARINEILEGMKRCYREIYDQLTDARDNTVWYPALEDIPKSLHVHGKSLEEIPHKKIKRIN